MNSRRLSHGACGCPPGRLPAHPGRSRPGPPTGMPAGLPDLDDVPDPGGQPPGTGEAAVTSTRYRAPPPTCGACRPRPRPADRAR